MATVVVVDYDPAWPALFERIRARVWPAVADLAVAIEHVGSTSVPGLAAKPRIDMDIVVPAREDVPKAIARLAPLGYVHIGDLGIPDREAFRASGELPPHNLYACHEGALPLRNHRALRDHLRAHPADARRYAALKKDLAARFPDDIDGYIEGKSAFIREILRQKGLTPDDLKSVEAANRKPPERSDRT